MVVAILCLFILIAHATALLALVVAVVAFREAEIVGIKTGALSDADGAECSRKSQGIAKWMRRMVAATLDGRRRAE